MKKKTLGFQATKKAFSDGEVLLPQTPEAYEEFTTALLKDFSLPDDQQTRLSVAEIILHLPKDQAWVKRSYIADGVRRGIAHLVAFNKYEEIATPLREAHAKKEAEEKAKKDAEKSNLKLVTDGVSTPDEQPVQGA